MIFYQGISASPGIAVGKAFLYIEDTSVIPRYPITPDEVEGEVSRYQRAVKKAGDEITQIKNDIADDTSDEHRMLESHLLMLYDPIFTDQVSASVGEVLKNVEWVLSDLVTDLVDKLQAAQDSYLRDRISDIHDVTRRVIDHLMYKRKKETLADLTREAIIVTGDLRPSDTVRLNKKLVKAILMDEGGKTSHTAILARSFGIPAVLGLGDITRKVRAYEDIIVDGNKGLVIINPDRETEERYLKELEDQRGREKLFTQLKKRTAKTTDGCRVLLKANIGIPEDTETVLKFRAEGVGLFRSEFLFMDPEIIPSEELQTAAYGQVLEAMGNNPVTIRTLDVGGDKMIRELEHQREKNPLLGWRAIRFCLDRRDLFLTQLRALLRASVNGNLRIMFPMISCEDELDRALEALEEARQDLKSRGLPFNEKIPVGIMIEIPSAALVSDRLAKKADFFSIGTNDLIQYTMAIDRGNEKVAHLYNPFHISILRLIKLVVANAHHEKITVGMCGEMAGTPRAVPLLLALGLDELSMSAVMIPEVKNIIRSISLADCRKLLSEVETLDGATAVETCLDHWLEARIENRTG
jgi:phosphotransferase system enzyme I (PtsI)